MIDLDTNVLVRYLTQDDPCQEFQVESADLAILAWQDYVQGNADFSDYLIGRTHQRLGASHTVTFDRKASSATTFKRLG